ncbi:MAG: histidinol phosphate phosphatase [Gammaproteobacteria bacterium]|nr:histidinol phosphate phosphatase [Gammaproteobacteria bacterium]
MHPISDAYLQTAIQCADQARKVTQHWFRASIEITSKQDKSPVTIADEETENVIKSIILNNHPNHSFIGEETGSEMNDEQWQWIIDPIDGTKSFATGSPTFGTLISLLRDGIPVLGVIDHGMLDERWIGVTGKPTTHNGKICRTRSTPTLDKASIYATTLDMFNESTFAQYDRLSKQCQFRVFGGDCYVYGLLSSGLTDIVCEADLKPYDYMALSTVVEGAGGIITDWEGKPLTLASKDKVLACGNKSLHQAALDILKQPR